MTKVYLRDETRNFESADEIQEYFNQKSGEELVKAHLEWKGRVTQEYLTRDLDMDVVEAKDTLDSLESGGFCYSRQL